MHIFSLSSRFLLLKTQCKLEFIKRTQALGFSLKEILELLSLQVEPGTTCGEIKARVVAKIADILKTSLKKDHGGKKVWKMSVRYQKSERQMMPA